MDAQKHTDICYRTQTFHTQTKKKEFTISLVQILIMKTHKKQICLQNKPYFHTTRFYVIEAFLTCLYISHYLKRLETKIIICRKKDTDLSIACSFALIILKCTARYIFKKENPNNTYSKHTRAIHSRAESPHIQLAC